MNESEANLRLSRSYSGNTNFFSHVVALTPLYFCLFGWLLGCFHQEVLASNTRGATSSIQMTSCCMLGLLTHRLTHKLTSTVKKKKNLNWTRNSGTACMERDRSWKVSWMFWTRLEPSTPTPCQRSDQGGDVTGAKTRSSWQFHLKFYYAEGRWPLSIRWATGPLQVKRISLTASGDDLFNE